MRTLVNRSWRSCEQLLAFLHDRDECSRALQVASLKKLISAKGQLNWSIRTVLAYVAVGDSPLLPRHDHPKSQSRTAPSATSCTTKRPANSKRNRFSLTSSAGSQDRIALGSALARRQKAFSYMEHLRNKAPSMVRRALYDYPRPCRCRRHRCASGGVFRIGLVGPPQAMSCKRLHDVSDFIRHSYTIRVDCRGCGRLKVFDPLRLAELC